MFILWHEYSCHTLTIWHILWYRYKALDAAIVQKSQGRDSLYVSAYIVVCLAQECNYWVVIRIWRTYFRKIIYEWLAYPISWHNALNGVYTFIIKNDWHVSVCQFQTCMDTLVMSSQFLVQGLEWCDKLLRIDRVVTGSYDLMMYFSLMPYLINYSST